MKSRNKKVQASPTQRQLRQLVLYIVGKARSIGYIGGMGQGLHNVRPRNELERPGDDPSDNSGRHVHSKSVGAKPVVSSSKKCINFNIPKVVGTYCNG